MDLLRYCCRHAAPNGAISPLCHRLNSARDVASLTFPWITRTCSHDLRHRTSLPGTEQVYIPWFELPETKHDCWSWQAPCRPVTQRAPSALRLTNLLMKQNPTSQWEIGLAISSCLKKKGKSQQFLVGRTYSPFYLFVKGRHGHCLPPFPEG